jgi:hypothetical protein
MAHFQVHLAPKYPPNRGPSTVPTPTRTYSFGVPSSLKCRPAKFTGLALPTIESLGANFIAQHDYGDKGR